CFGSPRDLPSFPTRRSSDLTHASVAEADSALRGARSAFYEAIEAAWVVARDGPPVPVELRNGLRLAATHATRTSADVVRALYDRSEEHTSELQSLAYLVCRL